MEWKVGLWAFDMKIAKVVVWVVLVPLGIICGVLMGLREMIHEEGR